MDIAFASSPADSALDSWPCFATHSVFVAGADYDCDFDHVYTRQEIADFPLILLERKASSRVFLEQYFLRSGITLTPEIELSSRQLLVSLARIGLGVAGVTLEFVRDALDSRGHPPAEDGLHHPRPQRGHVHPPGGDPHRRGLGLHGDGPPGGRTGGLNRQRTARKSGPHFFGG